jgi:hypothetical protein
MQIKGRAMSYDRVAVIKFMRSSHQEVKPLGAAPDMSPRKGRTAHLRR